MSKMVVLDELALQYVTASKNSDLSERRREHQRSALMFDMMEILRPVARKIATLKNMLSNEDDVQQHTMIAILKALDSWDHAIASFSTHVHYHIQWELGSFEHYAFPERRRIKVKQPIRFAELDRPLKKSDGEEGFCMLDLLVDENAESDIEENVERNRLLDYLERVMGVYVDIRWNTMRKLESGRVTQEKEVSNLCRDIDIYLQTRINGITHASLSVVYGITRERVRQIIGKVELAVKDHLPTKDENSDDYEPPVNLYAGPQSDRWEALASWYWHATERDIRHTSDKTILPYEDILQFLPPIITTECRRIKTDALVIEREAAIDRKAKRVEAANKSKPNPAPKTAEIVCIEEAREAQAQKSKVTLSKKTSMARQLAMPFMAAAVLASGNANAQVSRAIPPVEQTVPTTQIATQTPVKNLRKGSEAGTGFGNTWAIKLDAYDSAGQMESASRNYLENYPDLRSAKRATINDQSGKLWLSYGPYQLPQAKSLCVEIIANNKRCTVVRLST